MTTIASAFRSKFLPALAGACLLAGLPAPAASAGDGSGRELPPVERRANELFEALRHADATALRELIESTLHPSFLELGPMELHLEQFGKMRQTLGDFEVDGIRLSGPDRGDFVLRSGSGQRYSMHVETEPIEPYRIAGVGLEPYNPDAEIPSFESLVEAERHLQRLAERNEFSGVILVARDGEDDWVRAYGMANKEKGLAVTPQTRFNVGSITKALTGVAVMQLVERGKIDLEAPMSRYLHGFPPEIADRVPVIDLLRMRSGYGDYYTRAFLDRRDEIRTISDYLDLFRTFELQFEPGTKELYSNTGYVILGGIVEAVSGMSYQDYVEKNIYVPAGMKDSSFRDLGKDDPRVAVGYTNDAPSGRRGYVETNRSILDLRGNPSGGSVSTAADLLRFNRALRGNRLLSEADTTFLLNQFEEAQGRPSRRAIAGGAPGVSAVSFEDSDVGVTVIVLSNYDEPLAEDVGRQVFRMLTDGGARRGDEARAVAVPMSLINDQPTVEVRIAGEGPFRFLVDTGAAGAGRISPELVKRFGLEVVGQVVAADPSGRNTATRDLVRVGELSLGGHTWRDVDMLLAGDVRHDPGIDGILGFELFRDFLLTLDYPGEELRLEPGELPAPDGRDVLEFRLDHGVAMIDIDVAGTTVAAHLDSGSMAGLVIPESVVPRLPLAGEPKVVGRASTSLNEFEIKAATLDGELHIGRHALAGPQLEFADLFPDANVGGRLLQGFAVTFDQKNRRVRFARDDSRPARLQPRYRVGLMLARSPGQLLVQGTVPGSPAERAGLQPGDSIVRVNGTALQDLAPEELGRVFGSPEEVVLDVLRDGAEVQVRLTPEPAS